MSGRINYAQNAVTLAEWWKETGDVVRRAVNDDSLSDADASIDFIAQWLADGNSLQDLCTHYSLNWGMLAAWIRKDPVRDHRFRQAMSDRGAIRKERLLDGWWKTANEKPIDDVTHGDVHKAREALAKSEGLFSDAAKVQIDNHISVTHRIE